MDLLFKLINAYGVSGAEDDVRELVRKAIKPYVSTVTKDTFGNLIAHKKGKGPRIMLAAHMDEVGLMVKRVSQKGSVYFSPIGGLDTMSVIGQRVIARVHKGDICGVITTKEMSAAKYTKGMPELDEMLVDFGLTKSELHAAGVEPGTYLLLVQEAGYMANKKALYGKALDDRLGCYILIELAKRCAKLKNEICYVFTVQEEIGLYGAKTSAYLVNPDWAIVVDVTDCDDKLDNWTRKMGEGPCLTVKDSQMLGNRYLNEIIRGVAKKKGIPLQMDISDTGTTDALNISLSRGGVPSSVVSVAVRNLHSTFGVASPDDIKNAIALLEALLRDVSDGRKIR